MEVITYRNEGERLNASMESLQKIGGTGCFLLENCLDTDTVDSAHLALKSLFDVPEDVKASCFIDKLTDPLAHGYSPYGVSRARDTGIPNLLETWDISPNRSKWPPKLTSEWDALRHYQLSLARVAIKALKVIEDILGVNKGELTELVDEQSIEGIHLIHYFPIGTAHDLNARRQSVHCDNTLITVIPPPFPLESGIMSYNRDSSQWETVLVEKNDCFIQAGLVLERITGGKIKANIHTVADPRYDDAENLDRYSTPFFYSPRRGSVVRLLSGMQSEESVDPIAIEDLESEYFSSIFDYERIPRP
jgi:isopenicillin N synthase-like dioxygenase